MSKVNRDRRRADRLIKRKLREMNRLTLAVWTREKGPLLDAIFGIKPPPMDGGDYIRENFIYKQS